jgi:hypothetical protein
VGEQPHAQNQGTQCNDSKRQCHGDRRKSKQGSSCRQGRGGGAAGGRVFGTHHAKNQHTQCNSIEQGDAKGPEYTPCGLHISKPSANTTHLSHMPLCCVLLHALHTNPRAQTKHCCPCPAAAATAAAPDLLLLPPACCCVYCCCCCCQASHLVQCREPSAASCVGPASPCSCAPA